MAEHSYSFFSVTKPSWPHKSRKSHTIRTSKITVYNSHWCESGFSAALVDATQWRVCTYCVLTDITTGLWGALTETQRIHFTLTFELFMGECSRKPFTVADFLWSRIRQCIPQFKKRWGGQTCSGGGWVYNGRGEELLWSSNFSWQQLQSRGWLTLHKDVSSAGETGSWAKGLPSSCSDWPGFARFSYLIWNSTYLTDQPNRTSSC